MVYPANGSASTMNTSRYRGMLSHAGSSPLKTTANSTTVAASIRPYRRDRMFARIASAIPANDSASSIGNAPTAISAMPICASVRDVCDDNPATMNALIWCMAGSQSPYITDEATIQNAGNAFTITMAVANTEARATVRVFCLQLATALKSTAAEKTTENSQNS